jgi:hypothetical protein
MRIGAADSNPGKAATATAPSAMRSRGQRRFGGEVRSVMEREDSWTGCVDGPTPAR